MATGDVERYIAELENAIAQGRLQLDRDRFDQIEVPTYQNVTLPSSIAANTGMLPGGYVGGYGGMASAPFLDTNVNMMGRIGATVDPRLAALGYGAGDLTLAGQQQRTAEEQQRFQQGLATQEFGASRSDADRAFTEAQRAQVQSTQANDFQMSLEAGVPIMNGSPMPAWMQPHQEWARQFQFQNGGTPPGYADLVKALAPAGRVPEDYNGGQPYPGQPPAAGPGIAWTGQGYQDLVTGKPVSQAELPALIQQRQGQASNMTMDANGQPLYAQRPGIGAAGVGADAMVGVGDFERQQSLSGPQRDPARYASGAGPTMQGGPALTYQGPSLAGAGPTQSGGPALTYQGPPLGGLPAYQGPTQGAAGGLSFAGSGATAQIGAGTPTSQAQRQLIEQGRQSDVSAQLSQRGQDLQNAQTQNAQRIQEKQVEYQNAVASGNLELANRAQTELTDLNNRKLALDQEIQRGQLGVAQAAQTLAEGREVGYVNGQETLSRIGLFGQDATGNRTLESQVAYGGTLANPTLQRESLYGGAGLVGGGQTLEAQQALGYVGGAPTLARQQAENQTALGYLGLQAGLRGPSDAFQALKVQNSTPGGLRDLVDAAAGRFKMGQFGGGDPNSLKPASVDSLTNPGAGLTGGAGPTYQGQAGGRTVLSGQWDPQNVAKMTDYQRQVLLAQQEAMGQDPQAALQAFQQSLPRYSGPRRAAVRPF